MVHRYVSASERAKVLAQGLTRYSVMMDSKAGSLQHDSWMEWSRIWGPKMVEKVIEIHEANLTWSINYME